ncbi:MAG: hypothetical protein E6G10_22860 [Actinobacteria bacterium]|nr:MAG: hypothetical protein E6G10_22860 [Actinomycetota bacterium]
MQFDEFLGTFEPRTRERMQRLFAGLATAFHGRAGALNDTLGHSAPYTANLDDVLETLDGQSSQLQGPIANAGRSSTR